MNHLMWVQVSNPSSLDGAVSTFIHSAFCRMCLPFCCFLWDHSFQFSGFWIFLPSLQTISFCPQKAPPNPACSSVVCFLTLTFSAQNKHPGLSTAHSGFFLSCPKQCSLVIPSSLCLSASSATSALWFPAVESLSSQGWNRCLLSQFPASGYILDPGSGDSFRIKLV